MKRIKAFLRKNLFWLLIVLIPGCILSYEVYKWIDLSGKIDQEKREIESLKRREVSLDREVKDKESQLQKISSQNEKFFKELEDLVKYKSTTSVNAIITGLFIKHRVKLLSLKTSKEKGKGPVSFISVELSSEGNEDNVIKLLSSLNNNIPMELQSLELLLHTQNLLMNLTFKVPVVELRRQQ
ncbi:hypothetical protein [Desulfurobacterium crinifex]